MKISREVDVHVNIGESRSLRFNEELDFFITGEEIMQVLHSEFNCETEYQLKTSVNLFAQFVKAVPDEMIQGLSPEARTLIAGFLEGSAKRFAPAAEPVPA